MRRGEIRIVAGGPSHAGNWYTGLDSITICPFTSDNTHAPCIRIPVKPTENNGLRSPSWLMPDKLVTVPKSRLGSRTGQPDGATLAELSRNIIAFLNLAEHGAGQHPAPPARRG